MSDDEKAKKPDPATRTPVKAHVPLPAVLVGLGLLAAPAAGHATTARDDFYSTPANTSIGGVNILANDTFTNVFSLFVNVGSPLYGNSSVGVSGAGQGLLSYTPKPGFVGVDSFQYTINDGTGNSTATVTLAVGVAQAVPALAPAGVAALSLTLAALMMRRRRPKA